MYRYTPVQLVAKTNAGVGRTSRGRTMPESTRGPRLHTVEDDALCQRPSPPGPARARRGILGLLPPRRRRPGPAGPTSMWLPRANPSRTPPGPATARLHPRTVHRTSSLPPCKDQKRTQFWSQPSYDRMTASSSKVPAAGEAARSCASCGFPLARGCCSIRCVSWLAYRIASTGC